MGIPGLFRYLCDEFPCCIKKINEKMGDEDIDKNESVYIGIDTNAVIHPVCQKIYQYGEVKIVPKFEEKKKETKEEKDRKVPIYVINEIEEFRTKLTSGSTSYLSIAIDGVSGRSKALQQMKRRFVSSVPESFNPNCISLGTDFMYNLSKDIKVYLEKKIPKYIFSSDRVPGEGEHKLIHILKKLLLDGKKINKCYFVSSDADLVMICLALFEWCEENKKNVDINVIRTYKDVSHNININKLAEYLLNKKINTYDFILLCFFIGNDFLPHTPSLDIHNDGINKLLFLLDETKKIVYKNVKKNKLSSNNQVLTITQNGKTRINLENFLIFLKIFDKHERKWLKERLSGELLYKDEIWEKYPHRKYISIYNKLYFSGKKNKACKNYLEGLDFVLEYYTNYIPRWDFSFDFSFAPFVKNIVKFIEKKLKLKSRNNEFPFLTPLASTWLASENGRLTTIEQLVSILPTKSKDLVPKECQDFIIDREYKIIKSGINEEYEQVVEMKCPTFKEIKTFFSKIAQSEKTKELNKEEKDIYKV